MPHRLNTHGLIGAMSAGCGVSQPDRKIAHEHCLVVLGQRRFGEVGQIFHPMQTWLDLVTEIRSEGPDVGELSDLVLCLLCRRD